MQDSHLQHQLHLLQLGLLVLQVGVAGEGAGGQQLAHDVQHLLQLLGPLQLQLPVLEAPVLLKQLKEPAARDR